MLRNKTILIVSPQLWGGMFLSKHHYSIELAKRGNKVFFLNPPDQKKELPVGRVQINPSGVHENLFLVTHRTYFPYNIKFRSLVLFHFLMKKHVKNIENSLPGPVDIVWSFDIGNIYPLPLFSSKSFKVFHPVDEPLKPEAIQAARGSRVILSVTKEILEKYKAFNIPQFLVQHGVKDEFVRYFSARPATNTETNNSIQVGYAGNMLRGDIDRSILLQIIKENPTVHFNFYGSYKMEQANLGGGWDEAAKTFIQTLEEAANVKLHGTLNQQQLAGAFAGIDAFLVCYDIEKDASRGTNYHKLMEYLATGRVIISNNITAYSDKPVLIQMVSERNGNQNLPTLFNKVIYSLTEYNKPQWVNERKQFAASNTYEQQTSRIETILEPVWNEFAHNTKINRPVS